MITQDEVRRLFDYKDGKLFWKVSRGKVSKGREAGYSDAKGYRIVGIKRRHYKAHRLIWLHHYGYFPENSLDHINRNTLDNRITNLREVSNSCNIRNTGVSKNNTSGVKGVYWHKKERKWYSHVKENGRTRYLGRYDDFDEAILARLTAEKYLDWAGCDSHSPAYRYCKENQLIQ